MSQSVCLTLQILAQCAALAVLAEDLVPASLFALTAVVALGWPAQPLSGLGRLTTLALLMGGSFAHGAWLAEPPGQTFARALYPTTLAISEFLLGVQVLELATRRRGEPLSATLPACGVGTFMAMANVLARGWQSAAYEVCVAVWLVGTAGFVGAARRPVGGGRRRGGRAAVSAATLAVVLAGGHLASQALEQSWQDLDRMLARMPFAGGAGMYGAIGFSKRGLLGTVLEHKLRGAHEVALRVRGNARPVYLRGAAFTRLEPGRWQTAGRLKPVLSTPAVAPRPGASLLLRPGEEGPWQVFEITSNLKTDARFLPLDAAVVLTDAPEGTLDVHDVLEIESSYTDWSYAAGVPATSHFPAPTPAYRAELLHVPADLRANAAIRKLEADIFAGCRTPEEKCAAVVEFFRKNFRYELGIQIPHDAGPVTTFLLEIRAGHCELFATSAVMLLRLGGVPCRYVTGFVAADYNTYGGYWVARNRDAHAWVEVYTEERGWTVVEPTPSAGVPEAHDSYDAAAFWDDLKNRVRDIQDELAAGSWRGVLGALRAAGWTLITTIPGWIAIVLLGAWGVARGQSFVVYYRSRQRHAPTPGAPLLRQVDQRLRRRGLVRAPTETLHQFAARLRTLGPDWSAAAEWYEAFAAARYQPQSADAGRGAFEPLASALPAVPRSSASHL